MRFRRFAIATLLALLVGTASLHAEFKIDDPNYLNAYSRMTYTNVYVSAGQTAIIGVNEVGNTKLRLSIYDNNHNLIGTTVCQYTCFLRWVASANQNFYATVENLSPYQTDFGLAVVYQ